MTLYIMSGFKNNDDLLDKLGKHKTSKGCPYIRKQEDIDMKILEQIITQSVKYIKNKK